MKELEPGWRLKQSHFAIIAVAALFATIAIIVLVLSASRAEPASQFSITVAIIALIGTLWTGAITFVGLMLKESVDRRSALLQAESEKRLRMETALKAVELISRAEVEGAPIQESREAAIMVISSLNQNRLALGLGEQFWRTSKISTEAFVEIVNQCLNTDIDDLKSQCCNALMKNHQKLAGDPATIRFPFTYCWNWDGNLSITAKYDLLIALTRAMLDKPRDYWNIKVINGIAYCLYKMFVNDPDPRFNAAAAVLAINLCDVRQPSPEYKIMPLDRQSISYGEISAAAAEVIKSFDNLNHKLSTEVCDLSFQIQNWEDQRLGETTESLVGS